MVTTIDVDLSLTHATALVRKMQEQIRELKDAVRRISAARDSCCDCQFDDDPEGFCADCENRPLCYEIDRAERTVADLTK